MRVYVIGAVSGIAKDNRSAFERVRQSLMEALKCEVEIPHDIIPSGSLWGDAMRQSIRRLMEADLVAALPGWQKSKGATIEHDIAQRVGIPVTEVKL